MSIGNLKDQGNKGNNFPYQLKNLQLLGSINEGIADLITNGFVYGLPPTATDAFGRQRVSEPFTLFDSSHRYSDNGLWATSTSGGGTATFNADQGLIDLTVPLTDGAYVLRETYKVFSYQPGKSLLLLNTFVMNPTGLGIVQRVGYFSEQNGFFLELDGNKLAFIKRSYVTGSVVNTPVLQANWNYDKLDGNGPSGITLDITKAQILWTDMEWLGVGSVRMGFVIDGKFILCHTFDHANIVTSTYITTASLPLRYEIRIGVTTAGNATLKQICSSVIIEGGYELRGKPNSLTIPITTPKNLTVAGTYYPIMSIRLKSTKLDSVVIPKGVSVLPASTGNYSFLILSDVTVSGGSWLDYSADSAVQYNISGTSYTGGSIALSGFFSQTNQASSSINISGGDLFRYQLDRNSFTSTAREFTLAVAAQTIGGGGVNVFGSIDWEEISR